AIDTHSANWILTNGARSITDDPSWINNCVLINKTVIITIIDGVNRANKPLFIKTIIVAGVRWNNNVVLVNKTILRNEIIVARVWMNGIIGSGVLMVRIIVRILISDSRLHISRILTIKTIHFFLILYYQR